MFKKVKSTFNRYLTAVGDQKIIDERIKELFAYEKAVATKSALLLVAEAEDLQILSKPEQIKLMRALIIQKVANGESATEAIAALALLENQPPHAIKHDHLYSIPVLTEIGDIIRCGFWLAVLTPAVIALMLHFNPSMCAGVESTANNSQVCNAARAFNKFFYDYANK
ncbi:hypothetical protein NIES4075_69310 [Tolypothrix sp. NIES-4075]|uniref:hypothetical protein n=1 Tax=Tolypothrix sp. NIES-4075 TaxID=2005459 RepID=UPI000B5C268F|nr:hypothetical protein [Tolypothrix sp. NIES-4075]GAX45910.1 hypothetical protein NIES4075_69310 [Tolypothrix sp. NIES-4075]